MGSARKANTLTQEISFLIKIKLLVPTASQFVCHSGVSVYPNEFSSRPTWNPLEADDIIPLD